MLKRDLHQMPSAASRGAPEQAGRTHSLLVKHSLVNVSSANSMAPIRRVAAGVSAEDAALSIVALCVAGKSAPGDSFTVVLEADDNVLARFPGAVQRQFLDRGYGLDDLKAGLTHAVERGWLTEGRRLGVRAEAQNYVVTQAAMAIDAPNKE